MKKLVLTLAVVLCCASLFTSCQKGNTQQQETNKPDTTPAFVEMVFSFTLTQDMLDYTDFVASYSDGTETKTENVTALKWTKTLKVALPCTLTFDRKVSMKSGAELTDDVTFAYSTAYSASYDILNAAGQKLDKGALHSSSASGSGKGSKVAELINGGRWNTTFEYKFDKNGNELD